MSPAVYIVRYGTIFLVAFAVSVILEPFVMALAKRLGIVDKPDWRKLHKGGVARAGGLVFFPSLVIGFIVALYFWPVLWRDRYFGLVLAAFIISLTGVWDDVFGMRGAAKFTCQCMAGAVLYNAGYQLNQVSIPLTRKVVELGAFDFVIVVVGTAAIINCINMLDGLDGLAAGSTVIMCAFLLINKLSTSDPSSGLVLVVVIGAALAFLCYNFHPAKVFMGDTGSMFLGLILAAETLDSASQGAALTTILLPLVILAIPIFDMLKTVLMRMKTSRNIFAADKNHLHHHLLELGMPYRQVVIFIYSMNVYAGIMAMIYKHVEARFRGFFLVGVAMFLFMTFYLIAMGRTDRRTQG